MAAYGKIKPGSSDLISGRDFILIDLSSWYREAIEPKLSLIQTAIEQRHEISFDYYAPDKESHRTIEPYFLIFKWSSWYVYGWCKTREDFRLFKLNRMAEMSCGQAVYEVRKVPAPDLSVKKRFPGGIYVEAVFTPDVNGVWWRSTVRIVLQRIKPETSALRGSIRILRVWYHGCLPLETK